VTEAESTYASQNYMSNSFGVDAQDAARSGLQQFEASDGIKDATFRAALTYKLNRSWSFTGVASVKQLLGDAADSPITDDEGSKTQLFGGATINCSF